MEIFILIYLIVILAMVWMYTKKTCDLLNPLVLFYCPISFSYYLYFFLYKSEYQISYLTNFVFLLGCTSFGLGYLIIQISYLKKCEIKKKINQKKNLYYEKKILKNNYIRNILMFIGMISFIIGVCEFFYYGFQGSSRFFINIRFNSTYGEGNLIIVKYGVMILFIVSCMYLYQYLNNQNIGEKKKMKKILIFLIFSSISSTFFSMARTGILHYTLAYVYIYLYFEQKKIQNILQKYRVKNNIKKMRRKIGSILILVVITFIIIANLLGKSGNQDILSKNFFFYKYIGFPLVAFDMYIKNFPSVTGGYFILGPFGKVLVELDMFKNMNYIGAPDGSFNVYSYLQGPYLDFGILGILLVMLFIGMIVALIYRKSYMYGGMWTIFYANYSYAIIMAFYAYQFSNTFYLYLFVVIIFMQLSIKK